VSAPVVGGEASQQRLERRTSIRVPLTTSPPSAPSISAAAIAVRSSSVNSGSLPALIATATISRSTSVAARRMTSMCPLWIGSKVPG
jgi:hypothetical protein